MKKLYLLHTLLLCSICSHTAQTFSMDSESEESPVTSETTVGETAWEKIKGQGTSIGTLILHNLVNWGMGTLIKRAEKRTSSKVDKSTRFLWQQWYKLSEDYSKTSLLAKRPALATGTALLTYGVTSIKSMPVWAKNTIRAVGYIATAVQTGPTLQFIAGRRFFIQQDKTRENLSDIFTQTPILINKIVQTLTDKSCLEGFYRETGNTMTIFGNSSIDDKRSIVRGIAAGVTKIAHKRPPVPLFFLSRETFRKSRDSVEDVIDQITDKAQSASYAYNTPSIICIENLTELFNEHEEIRTYFTERKTTFRKISSKFCTLEYREEAQKDMQILIIGIDDEEQSDPRLGDLFSFKLDISTAEAEHEADDKHFTVSGQNSPSFEPYDAEKNVNELRWYETGSLKLKDIPGGYPTQLDTLCRALQRECKDPIKSILLWGEPGTGKTMVAEAFAGTLQVPYVNVPHAYIFDKKSNPGDQILYLFQEAQRKAIANKKSHAIVFFDEFDKCLKDESKAEGLEETLKKCLNDPIYDRVVVIATTNLEPRDWNVSLTRPGRFNYVIHYKLPATKRIRKILPYHLKQHRMTMEAETVNRLTKTLGGILTPAEIAAAITMAKVEAKYARKGISFEKALETRFAKMTAFKNRLKTAKSDKSSAWVSETESIYSGNDESSGDERYVSCEGNDEEKHAGIVFSEED